MLKRLLELLNKHRDLLVYLALGVGTTIVNYVVYYPLLNIWCVSAAISNIVAWVCSVAFAFVTNKLFAFSSKSWSANIVFPELSKFVSCRVVSGVIETAFLILTVDILSWNGNIMKLLISIFVVIANYIASKYFVFHK